MGDFRAGHKKRIPYFTAPISPHSGFSFVFFPCALCILQHISEKSSSANLRQGCPVSVLFLRLSMILSCLNDKSALIAFEDFRRAY